MPAVEPYASLTDCEWGEIPTPVNAQFWLDKGAEEIDAKIGFTYATPVVLGNSAEERPAKLLLKRINAWLCMGRAILSRAVGGEDDTLHALGEYYVKEATAALNQIADGTIVIPGADPATPTETRETGPMIYNVDNASAVESFSEVFGNPASQVITATRPNLIGSPYTW